MFGTILVVNYVRIPIKNDDVRNDDSYKKYFCSVRGNKNVLEILIICYRIILSWVFDYV